MTAVTKTGSRSLVGLAGWIALTAAAATLGGWASAEARVFYAELAQPSWAPPGAVFGPVWTALYAMMAVAAWLAWRERGWTGARFALSAFVVQLALNALWSWLFFAWRQGAAAFVEILILWTAIAVTAVAFWRVRRLAAALLVPYLLWVTFAAVLNFAVWRMNVGRL